jgi:transketolase
MKLLIPFIEHKAYRMRINAIRMTTRAGSGHVTSALSAADIVAALFFSAMKFDPQNSQNPDNDRFVLSKGHASPVLYAVWKELGLLTEKELMKYRTFGSVLEGHPTPAFEGAEVATGSLGIGLSAGLGMALAARMDKRKYHTWVLMGDGEIAEGSVWEAAQLASYYKVSNLTAIVDINGLGQANKTMEDIKKYKAMWQAFGWKVFVVDGHDIEALCRMYEKVRRVKQQPCVILAHTIKGKGVALVQDKMGWHGKAFTSEQETQALQQLARAYRHAATYKNQLHWKAQLPEVVKVKEIADKQIVAPTYKKGELVATRYAYGQALAALGTAQADVVALDGEVKNSTYAELFEKKHPKRFIECFIAEQNMVSMAVGLSARGKTVFCSTFACFFTRAFDQLRMAAIGSSKLTLVGSHAGVSIGQDGPSQMGLEDIAMFRTLPHSVVVHPCDAVSTGKLVEALSNYEGVSYLRTLRPKTPVLYDTNEQFSIGGCKVLRAYDNAVACIVATGYPVFEALKAHDALLKKNIHVSVIDLYSIKPLDRETVLRVARKSGHRIITVEDHYPAGGMGEAVTAALRNEKLEITCLAVTKLPHSGSTEELYAYEGINAAAIEKAVRS